MTGAIKRGALIVFEGCDRSGKTTQVTKLVERFNAGLNLEYIKHQIRPIII